jgi:hypothetical protein|tara:strand:- start:41 stop:505 length:465 start_codon:yes stop_codon:yes gene_type:complete
MTEYRKQSDGTLIEGVTAFKNLFPNTSFPKVIDEALVNSLGYDWVYDSTQPSVTPPYESVVRDGVEQVSGKWQTKFKVETADADGKTAIDNRSAISRRSERDELLKDSDWTQLADKAGLADSKVTEWATYRQSLRDLPTASGWPHTHTLPTKPS